MAARWEEGRRAGAAEASAGQGGEPLRAPPHHLHGGGRGVDGMRGGGGGRAARRRGFRDCDCECECEEAGCFRIGPPLSRNLEAFPVRCGGLFFHFNFFYLLQQVNRSRLRDLFSFFYRNRSTGRGDQTAGTRP